MRHDDQTELLLELQDITLLHKPYYSSTTSL